MLNNLITVNFGGVSDLHPGCLRDAERKCLFVGVLRRMLLLCLVKKVQKKMEEQEIVSSGEKRRSSLFCFFLFFFLIWKKLPVDENSFWIIETRKWSGDETRTRQTSVAVVGRGLRTTFWGSRSQTGRTGEFWPRLVETQPTLQWAETIIKDNKRKESSCCLAWLRLWHTEWHAPLFLVNFFFLI